MIKTLKAQQKTITRITHRLSKVFSVDKIAVLDKCQIVEEAKHDDLINNRGNYFELADVAISIRRA